MRELVLGPKRFTDLRAALPRVSADVLAQRLRELAAAGVLRRTKLPPPAGSRVYELTAWGQDLEPVVLALGRWGSRGPFPEIDGELSTDALVIALKTLFDAERAGDWELLVELRLGDQRFRAQVGGGRLEIARGVAERADASIGAEPPILAGVLWHDAPRGRLAIDGDADAARAFLSLFPPPEPA